MLLCSFIGMWAKGWGIPHPEEMGLLGQRVENAYEDRRRKPTIFSRGMNPYTPG